MIYLHDEDLARRQRASLDEGDIAPANLKHIKALRLGDNDEIAFLDLAGKAAVYKILSPRPLKLSFEKNLEKTPSASIARLYLAPPLGSALEQSVEQATEVGYDEIYFLRSQRVQYPKGKELNVARLRRIVEASCLQCGRFWAPRIADEWSTLATALASADCWNVCADEGAAEKVWGSLRAGHAPPAKNLAIFIGPEGGWSEEERQRLHAQTSVFSLGPNILRVPTAVVAAYVLTRKELNNG